MLPSYSWKSDVKNKLLLESKDAKCCPLTAPYILIPADPSCKIQAFSQSFQDQYTLPGHGAQLLVCKTQRHKRLFLQIPNAACFRRPEAGNPRHSTDMQKSAVKSPREHPRDRTTRGDRANHNGKNQPLVQHSPVLVTPQYQKM